MRARLTSTLALIGVSIAALAHAQQPAANKAPAVQLFDEADRLMGEGKVNEACPKYAASMKLDPQLGALLHLADCYAKNGQLASAWGSFREAQEMAQLRGDDRAALAKEQAAKLEPRLSRITIIVPPRSNLQGLEVRVDGAPITAGAWGVATPIDAGSHGIEARAPGHDTWSSSIDVTGETQSVRVEIPLLTQSPAAPPPTRGGGDGMGRTDDVSTPWPALGWVGVGVGAVGLGLGGVFLVQKQGKLDDRDRVCGASYECTTEEQVREIESLTQDADTANTLATASFVAGGVLLAAGMATLIFAPSRKPRTDSAWLIPAISTRGLGFTGGMKW